MSASSFDTFVESVNDWMLWPDSPATEAEVLQVWSLGQRNASLAAMQIESVRRLTAKRSHGQTSLGEFVTGLSIVPVGIALVAFFSLMDDAEAATVLVATREGVLAYSIFTLILGIAIGYVLCWWTAPRVHEAASAEAGEHPDVIRLRNTRVPR